MPFTPRRHIPLILGALGTVFLSVGVFLLTTDAPRRDAVRGTALPRVTARSLSELEPGSTVLLEGRLAQENPKVFRDFLACRRERFMGVESSGANKGRERWEHLETLTPPLVIDAGDGRVSIVNHRYELQSPPQRWRDVDTLGSELFGRRGEAASGFMAGDLVTIEAQVVTVPAAAPPGANPGANAPRALDARLLFGGSHAAYLAHLRDGVLAARIIGSVFIGVAALLLTLSVAIFRGGKPGASPREARPGGRSTGARGRSSRS